MKQSVHNACDVETIRSINQDMLYFCLHIRNKS